MTDWLVGIAFIAGGIGILCRAAVRLSRPPEVMGRNQAVRRMLELEDRQREAEN